MDCNTFRDRIYQFQADEIPQPEREEFQEHLDACAHCAGVLRVEDGFLRALKARIPREQAPPGLETRVRAALRAEAPEPRRLAWYRTPWFAATAAALLLVVILVPTLDTGEHRAPLRGVVQVADQAVVVVDLDCDRAGKTLEEQRRCKHPHHVNALRTRDGRYWFISPDQEAYGAMIHDRSMRGRRMVINGVYYPAINTVHIDRSQAVNAI
jgi:anti-sigma factor (TIGR02949 family)